MSLRSVIQQAVQTGIAALDDLAERATYTSVRTPAYDALTGTISKPSLAYPTVPMVFTSYSRQEIDGETIRQEDQKAIIAQLALTPVPTLNDTITRADGTVWTVVSVRTDPAGAAWVLQCRRP